MASFNLPKYASILFDTCIFIDVFGHDNKYTNFFAALNKIEATIVSINPVKCEFIRSKTKEVIQEKSHYFDKTIESILPFDKDIESLVQPTIEEYGVDSDGLDVADIYLACFLKKYRGLYLLTKNHHHFPERIFSRSNIFNIELAKEIRTYAFYQYKTNQDEVEGEISEASSA